MNKNDYISYVIKPSLDYLDPDIPYSDDAVALLLLTALAESNLNNLTQIGGGPALGLLQMEPETETSLWNNHLRRHPELAAKVENLMIKHLRRDINLAGNMHYQIAIAREKYWQNSRPLPKLAEIEKMSSFYVDIYNAGGKANKMDVIQLYKTQVLTNARIVK